MNEILNLKSQISNSLGKIVKELIGLDIEPQIDIPNDLSKGDYTTNVAMIAFGNLKKQESRSKNYGSAMELAKEMVSLLNTKYKILDTFSLVEAKEPGFINFWLSNQEVEKQLAYILSGKGLISDEKARKEIIFEFGDPNPFKEPHIGHLRIFAVGEAVCRMLEADGNYVIRANYQGDVGLHVAKALYGIMNHESGIKGLDSGSIEEKAKFLGEAYVMGAKAFEEDAKAKKEIISINNKIYSKDSEIFEIWEKGRNWSLEYFETLYKALGIKYDKYYFESQTAAEGLKIVEENSPKIFEKNDGAYIFRGEKVGLHTRVFVTSEGYATYEGKDLALAIMKDKDFPDISLSIIMTANEQMEYFKVLIKALSEVNKKIADKASHLSVGFVNLKEGKMSSRTGNIIGANWLIDEVRKQLKKRFKEVKNEILDEISVGAVKWSMLKFSRQSNISFSIDESVDLAGNSGPYMQYTYARIASLLSKSLITNFEAKSVKSLDQDLLALSRLACQFEIQTKKAIDSFSPNILTDYLFKVAQTFNSYYEKEKIIGSPKEMEKLFVAKGVGEVIKRGLYLLGIESPAKI